MGVALFPLGDDRLEVYLHFCGSQSASAMIEVEKARKSRSKRLNLPNKGYASNVLTMARGYKFSYPEAKTSGDLMAQALRVTLREALAGNHDEDQAPFITQEQASICWKQFCAGMKPEGRIALSWSYDMTTSEPLNELEFDAPIEVKVENGAMAEVVSVE